MLRICQGYLDRGKNADSTTTTMYRVLHSSITLSENIIAFVLGGFADYIECGLDVCLSIGYLTCQGMTGVCMNGHVIVDNPQ